MTRAEAYQLLTQFLKNKNLIKHSLAAEAAMKAIYKQVPPKEQQNEQDEEKWGIAGLLHDIDYEVVQNENKLDQHGKYLFDTKQVNLLPEIEHAIRAHNYEATGTHPESPMDWGITCADQLTGLIVACALVQPERKLSAVSVDSVLKKMKDKAFAKGAIRKYILLCDEKLQIPLAEFVDIVLKSMQEISDQMEL